MRKMTMGVTPLHFLIATLVFMAFILFVLPSVSEATKIATGSERSPDTAFFYTAQDLYDIAEEYQPAGRSYYIRSRLTFDVVWPLVYGAFFYLGLMLVLKVFKALKFLSWLPVAGVIFDYLENMATATTMYVFPERSMLAVIAPYFTLVKWVLIYSAFGILSLGCLYLLLKKLFFRKGE